MFIDGISLYSDPSSAVLVGLMQLVFHYTGGR